MAHPSNLQQIPIIPVLKHLLLMGHGTSISCGSLLRYEQVRDLERVIHLVGKTS